MNSLVPLPAVTQAMLVSTLSRVVVRGAGDLADAFLPPYGQAAQAIVDSVFRSAAETEPVPPGSA